MLGQGGNIQSMDGIQDLVSWLASGQGGKLLKVWNRTKECDDGIHRDRDLGKADRLIFHKIHESLGNDAPSISKSFRNKKKFAAGYYTNGEMPYAIVIPTNGNIELALEIGDWGPHAARWNAQGIGVAVIGDFTKHKPTEAQVKSSVELSTFFGMWFGGVNSFGHTELPGASSNPKKVCPGEHFPMDFIRKESASKLALYAENLLIHSGVVF